jgi:DNA-binding LytR/AlgR family response regulator
MAQQILSRLALVSNATLLQGRWCAVLKMHYAVGLPASSCAAGAWPDLKWNVARIFLKVLIVDDQARTRESLAGLCARSGDVQVVGEAVSGKTGLDAARLLNPDILLLDVELPDMSGIDLLRTVSAQSDSAGIMLANGGDHAVAAFAEGAIDYLVTPVTAERFEKAMCRARDRLERALAGDSTAMRHSSDAGSSMAPRFLVGERQRRLYPIEPLTVDYIEADGNYVTLRVGTTEYLSRDSLKRLSTELEDLGFIRIERSLLVNAAAVSYLEVASYGTFALTLRSGVCLHSSSAYRDCILRVIPLPKRYRGVTQ